MAIEREVRWTARATLRALGETIDPRDHGMKAAWPTVVVGRGSLVEMVRHVMAQPADRRWRYTIASDACPYLSSEEIASLAVLADFADA